MYIHDSVAQNSDFETISTKVHVACRVSSARSYNPIFRGVDEVQNQTFVGFFEEMVHG